MSVLLTAARKNYLRDKEKRLKTKKKARSLANNNTPPMSGDGITVWYWQLEGVPTTVMFTEERNEVWCNGYILEISELFDDDLDIAGYIDFEILLDQTGSIHEGRIRRHIDQGGYIYQLFVDGYPIVEHSPGGTRNCPYYPLEREDSEIFGGGYGRGLLPEYATAWDQRGSNPPRYEEAISGGRGYGGGKVGGRRSPAVFDDFSDSFNRHCTFQEMKKTK